MTVTIHVLTCDIVVTYNPPSSGIVELSPHRDREPLMTSNPFRNRLAQLPTPAQRIDTPRITYGTQPGVAAAIRTENGATLTFPVTDRQIGFINDLLEQRDLSAEQRPRYLARLIELAMNRAPIEDMNRVQASALIDTLLDLPKRNVTVPVRGSAEIDVPAGRYAVDAADGTLMFVKVDRPTEGRWAGRVFVSRQLSDELVRMPRAHQEAVLDAIRADGPRQAAIRYGRELGKCSVCDRTLTNEESRAAGIGPICAGRNGW